MLVGVWLGLLWVSFYFFDHHIQSSDAFLGVSMGQSQNPLFLIYYGVHFFHNPNLP